MPQSRKRGYFRSSIRKSLQRFTAPAVLVSSTYTSLSNRLAGREGLGDNALQGELLLLQVITASILDLELRHGVAESRLDLLLLATLETERA
jgi:hypothetical protein